MTDAKRKDKASNEPPNLGQEEAEEERRGKDEMEHMGDRSRRETEKAKERHSEKSPQRPAHTSKA